MPIKNSLLITLGHNSSAVFMYDGGFKIIGYEQERIDGIKASSAFPNGAISKIIEHVGLNEVKGSDIYVSHWFDTHEDTFMFIGSKYMGSMDYSNLKALADGSSIKFCNSNFSHHDAHAYSAKAFFDYHIQDKNVENNEPVYYIVADGFGNNGEVLSVYEDKFGTNSAGANIEKIVKVTGYKASLGLMYQYATSFTGMKENQDEYKYLGYESHIDEHFDEQQIDVLDNFAEYAVSMLKKASLLHENISYSGSHHNLVHVDLLTDTKVMWHSYFAEVLDGVGIEFHLNDSDAARCAIAYLIQNTIEIYLTQLVTDLGIKNLVVSGGVFYNVKLNNALLKTVKGYFCAAPLAGDQGAAIGMYYYNARKQFPLYMFPFGSLCIGPRKLHAIEKMKNIQYNHICSDDVRHAVIDSIVKEICAGKIVNLVTGNMEFGPRALCNTTSLMLPMQKYVAFNNLLNDRNEVMPCAPVMTQSTANEMFDADELARVIGSDKFMICTHDYKSAVPKSAFNGVMHKKPLEDVYTGRPQIVEEDSFIGQILKAVNEMCSVPVLVNTSFNAHGRPIAFETMDIVHNTAFQSGILTALNVHETKALLDLGINGVKTFVVEIH